MPTDPTELEILIPDGAVVRASDLASAVIMLGECGRDRRLLRYDPLRATRRWTAVWGGDGTHLGDRGDGDTPLAAVKVLLARMREAGAPPRAPVGTLHYAGCRREAGHYWWRGGAWEMLRAPCPVTDDRVPRITASGAPLLACDEEERPDGGVRLTHADGWSYLAWWDRSVDPRRGSYSVLFAEGTHTRAALLDAALPAYSDVLDRQADRIALWGLCPMSGPPNVGDYEVPDAD